MKTLEEIQKDIANEMGEPNFMVLIESEIEIGDFKTAKKLMILAIDRFFEQFLRID